MQSCCQNADELVTTQLSKVDIIIIYPDHDRRSICVLETDVVDGIVSKLFWIHSFTYVDGEHGLEQSFIIVDELAWKLGDKLWQYKILPGMSRPKN